MQTADKRYEDFLAAALHGDLPSWPENADVGLMVHLGARHRVNSLINAAINSDQCPAYPADYIEAVAAEARQETGQEILRRRELRRLLHAFAGHSIQPLIMKGTALAYTHYDSPALRPRCDLDLLIAENDIEPTERLLAELGYTPGYFIPGRLITCECSFVRVVAGFTHIIDLHWRINGRQVFARTFDYHELLADAVVVDAIADNALALGPEHALLLACMHRVANLEENDGGNRLIWLFDIELLAKTHDDQQWLRTCELAKDAEIATVVLGGLRAAEHRFGPIRKRLADDLATDKSELSARLLNTNRRHRILTDVAALRWRDRLRLFREVVLPPRDYLRRRYGKFAALKHGKLLLAAPWRHLRSKQPSTEGNP